VFVHGITGNREETWTVESSDVPWPKAFIPEKLKDVRILGFGYAADVTHWWKMADKGTVYGYGKSLLNGLYAHRSLDGSVRFVWTTSSKFPFLPSNSSPDKSANYLCGSQLGWFSL